MLIMPSTIANTRSSTTIKKILYTTDFSEASKRALPAVAAIARKYGSEIFIANVWSPLPYSMGSPDAPVALEVEEYQDALARTRKFLECSELVGLHSQILVEEGDVGEQIARVVQERDVDLVVVSTHGRTGWKRFVMGSGAESLLRNLTCPVLTVGPKLAERFCRQFAVRRILFPTDFSEQSRSVFPFFASFAAKNACELVIAHILPEETGINPEAKKLAEPLRKDLESVYSPYIHEPCKPDFVIDFGDPVERVLALAEFRDVDLIAMAPRNAPEFVTHFRKTVTYRVVLGATCPVLTYRAS
jgi:nucleotide-binding universal stress UspA family protein